MACSLPLFPPSLRDRIFRKDLRVLEDVDEFLRSTDLRDEPRQHVLVWLDRAMQDQERLIELARVDNFAEYFRELARDHERMRKRGELIRALHERVAGRQRKAARTRRRLSHLELDELVTLVTERIRNQSALDAQLFVDFVFRNQTYEQVATALSARFGGVTVPQLRKRVARIRGELRASLAWYLKTGPSDVFVAEEGGREP